MYNKENYGPGKYFPGGPRCNFRNVDLPCYVTCSPKGSITSTILADILKFIDDRGVFPRHDNNPTPFLLLDGHGSRLEVPFLSYVNDQQHKWVVCIGCPNGTSLWQVGDSSEQNGCFKIYCAEHKRRLTSRRIEMGMYKLNLVCTDVIPIVIMHGRNHSRRLLQTSRPFKTEAGVLSTNYYCTILKFSR